MNFWNSGHTYGHCVNVRMTWHRQQRCRQKTRLSVDMRFTIASVLCDRALIEQQRGTTLGSVSGSVLILS